MNNLTVVDNPLIKRDMTILRDETTEAYQFRLALRRIAYSLAISISHSFELDETEVKTFRYQKLMLKHLSKLQRVS